MERTRGAWFTKVVRLLERPTLGENEWQELEELLLAADVGVATTGKLIQHLKERVKRENIIQAAQAHLALREEILDILKVCTNNKEPLSQAGISVILVIGVNGVGKTTSIAKLAYDLKQQGKRVILAAADTFRAAAIDQLRLWGQRLGAEVVAHQPGADPGAVVFDALEAARHRGAEVVIVDTAGRLHTKFNLMEELKKIKRVIARADSTAFQQVLLVLDATTGQNGLSQARYFTEAVGVNGIFLAKLDGTAKGGIVLAICDELRIPIQFIGTGERLDDLARFDPATFVQALLS